ncbi:hypothetical protein WJX84_002842 [Apatococcus fuscideae]|uniref:Ubiquitin carboxyl-terminal hydrolase n=1 Tax=Apatococcus fuscideae TaxID=2026836 RepID=A0AAW1T8Z6_9CHLO
MGKRWLPLESNPDVLNSFAKGLGFDTSAYAFCDIFGLDEELLAMVPQPVLAVLLLFPVTDRTEAARKAEDKELRDQAVSVPSDIFYMKQTIGNACGTIGLLHAIGNSQDRIKLEPASFLQSFLAQTARMTSAQRGDYLENPPEDGPDIDKAHEAAANDGSTAPPRPEDEVNLHFVALVQKHGKIWELDGRKAFPIDHGPSSPDSLLSDAAKVAQRFMSQSDSLSFNLIALASAA